MKIANSKPVEFTPVDITLTFESQEEIDSWYAMLGYNVSIPEMLDLSSNRKTILGQQMSMLRRALEGV